MTKNSFLLCLFAIFLLPICSMAKIAESKNYKILAKINEIAITKYDLDLYIKINSKDYINKSKEANYQKALEDYIDLNKKYIIAKKNGINIDKREETNYWFLFSKDIGTTKNIDTFCNEKNIDRIFLNSIMEKNYFWQKYINEYLRRNINISEQSILEYAEYLNKDNIKVRYNISEIVINYPNSDKKRQAKNIIESTYNKMINGQINFEKAAKSISQSLSAKNNGKVGWINDTDFSSSFLKNINNLNKGDFCKPFCIGKNAGACFIILLNDKEKYIDISDQEKMKIANELYQKMLNSKINNILSQHDDEIKITYYNH